jgi:DNA polymerase-3 subunit delta
MKLTAGQVARFLRDPGAVRVVLLFGDDVGMIRERANALVRQAAGSLDDPFRVADLPREAIGTLRDEAAGLALTGGRRVVRVRDVTEAAIEPVQAVLRSPAPALVVLQAGALTTRSRLRTLLEAAPDGVAIGCYPESGRALEDTVRGTLQAVGVRIDPDALGWLVGHLGADHAASMGELEKLALYVGPDGRVDLPAAMACVGDLAGLSLDDALFAATEGDVATADRALELAVAAGAVPVQVVRAGIGHMQRLHRARLAIEEHGLDPAAAVKALRPPLFFRRVAPFTRALRLWSGAALSSALDALGDTERGCKTTGWPDNALCRNAILSIARRAEAVAARRQ